MRRAVRVLRAGGVIAYPTEAVWGLGCDPLQGAAVARLLQLKARSPARGLILIAADFEQLHPYVIPTEAMLARALPSWPGPVTWLMPARRDVPDWLTGAHDTLAVRITAHPPAAALCAAFGGALVSTSANRSGRAPARSRLAVQRAFGNALDYVLPGPLGGHAKPSTIRDARSGRTLRPG